MKTIGFIGLGLIGGSIAKAIRHYYPDYRLLAYSRTPATVEEAIREKIIDRALEKEDPAFAECDLIFLCAPVQANISYMPFLKKTIRKTSIVTDVGSVKGEIMEAAEANGLSGNFIGGHPMAGSERTGLAASSAILLENAYYMLTPAEEVPKKAVMNLQALIASLKAIPMVLSPKLHDYVVAGVSHLPHIVAYALVKLVQDDDTDDELMKRVAAGGFRDITRIASSSPVMWEQICMANRDSIETALDEYIRILTDIRGQIDAGDGSGLRALFQQSKDYRDSLNDSARGSLPRSYVIWLDIADQAGGIATITTLLGMNGLSLKNIGIVHNREFEEGVLRIEFYDGASRDRAIEILELRNYTIRKTS